MMKKSLKRWTQLAFSVCLAFAALAAAGTFSVKARAAVQSYETVIEGVRYTLTYDAATGKRTGSVDFVPDQQTDDAGNYLTGEEVHIQNKVTFEGNEYTVDSVNFWETDACGGDVYDYSGPDDPINTLKKTSYYDTLKKIVIDEGISCYQKGIAEYKNLEEVVFKDAKRVEGFDFYRCPKLKSVYIPKEVKYYPSVQECGNVQITVDPENPYYQVIDNGIYSKDGTVLYMQCGGSAEYTVRNTVKKIEYSAFKGNETIEELYLPNSVKKIGTGAFAYMRNLTSIRMSKSVKKIFSETFRGCMKLKTIKFPKNVQKFEGAFGAEKRCGFQKIYINAASLKKSNLRTIPKTCRIYVKSAKVRNQVRKYGFKGKIIIRK